MIIRQAILVPMEGGIRSKSLGYDTVSILVYDSINFGIVIKSYVMKQWCSQ